MTQHMGRVGPRWHVSPHSMATVLISMAIFLLHGGCPVWLLASIGPYSPDVLRHYIRAHAST